MKVLLHYPDWKNRWEQHVIDALSEFDLRVTNSMVVEEIELFSKDADVLISMWGNQVVQLWTERFPEKKIITYLRRYEIWAEELMRHIRWQHVDGAVFVSQWCRDTAYMMWNDYNLPIPKRDVLIPNGIDIDSIPFRETPVKNKKIAMVCSMKEAKNIPLAFQILMELPEDYHLYHIGLPYTSQSACTMLSYAHGLGLTDRLHFEGTIKRSEVFDWLSDKEILLSTSLNEGNPNNIIEAMAIGVKPVIHSWPGARDQFPENLIFNRIHDAAIKITEGNYTPEFYRDWVKKRYNSGNFKQLTNLIKEVSK